MGADDTGRTDAVLSCALEVAGRGLADRLGGTVQANLVRSPDDADALAAAGVHIRLVKGAYVETVGAYGYGEPTDVAYLRLGFRLAEQRAAWSMATHDGRLREALLLGAWPVTVEHLLGVRPEVLDELRRHDFPTRTYNPIWSGVVPLVDARSRRIPRRIGGTASRPPRSGEVRLRGLIFWARRRFRRVGRDPRSVDAGVAEDVAALGRQWLASQHTIDSIDLAVAATAVRTGTRSPTCNVRHFPAFPDLHAVY